MKIAFFGTSEFAAIILEKLINSPYKPSLVVTMPDRPAGRKQIPTPSPVKNVTGSDPVTFDAVLIQPEKLTIKNVTGSDPVTFDLFIVAAYGAIIPKKVLEIPKYGSLNVHPSLLPRWRGPSPIQYAILNGDEEMGVTIMLLDEELDHGPILAQSKFLVSNDATSEVLLKQFAEIGANMLINTIPKWVSGEIEPKEQDHEKATFSKLLAKEDGCVDWLKSAEEIDRQVRAFTPWPGTFTFFNNTRLKIISGKANNSSLAPERENTGKVISNGAGLAIQTGAGVYTVEKLQPEGKREMSAKEFVNGYPEIIGAKLS